MFVRNYKIQRGWGTGSAKGSEKKKGAIELDRADDFPKGAREGKYIRTVGGRGIPPRQMSLSRGEIGRHSFSKKKGARGRKKRCARFRKGACSRGEDQIKLLKLWSKKKTGKNFERGQREGHS